MRWWRPCATTWCRCDRVPAIQKAPCKRGFLVVSHGARKKLPAQQTTGDSFVGVQREHRRILDRFPAALRTLVEAELAAGNTIVETGVGHPVPPAGDGLKFAHDLSTPLPVGLKAYARNSSLHHTEVTDQERMFWVFTAAHPPPPAPDMNLIRDAHATAPVPIPVEKLHAPGSIEMDFRGELLIYHEAERRTEMVWTWSRGNHFYLSSLTHWWYPIERRSVPLTPEEKEQLLERFLAYGRANIGRIEVVD